MKASDLKRQLENDPVYKDRIKKRDAELQSIWEARRKDQQGLVNEINECGYSIESVYDLVNNSPHGFLKRNHIGDYSNAYAVLVRHLDIPHDRIIREGIIRSLTVRDGGREVEEALLRHFEMEKHAETKWCIANALMVAMPYHRRRKRPEIERFYKAKSE